MRRSILSLAVVVSSFGFVGSAMAETHPFSIHDMLAMERISDPQVSPDGKRIVFALRTTDLEANRGRTDLWLVGIDGSGLKRLTTHPASDFNARWSPGGQSIWFLSTRSARRRFGAFEPTAENLSRHPISLST